MVILRNMLSLTWLVMLCTNTAIARPGLEANISSHEIELGKPLTIILKTEKTSPLLGNIDLSELANNFYIDDRQEVITSEHFQQRNIRLYPRRMGLLIIPSLNFDGQNSPPVKIRVTPPHDPKDNSLISISTHIPEHQAWLKQQCIIRIELTSKEKILSLKTPTAYSAYGKFITLDTQREPVVVNQQPWTRHTAGWAFYPERTGKFQLKLPAIRLIRDGTTSHQFYLPIIEFDVKPLPIYIPATMPVGKIRFTNEPATSYFSLTGRLNSLHIGLASETISPYLLQQQFDSNSSISYYPPGVTHTLVNHNNKVNYHSDYQVNFRINDQGWHEIGDISISYFDPQNGKITTIHKQLNSVFSLPGWLTGMFVIFSIAALVFIMIRIVRWLKNQYRLLVDYKNIIRQLHHAEKPQQIYKCLKQIAKTEHWPGNMTIRQWLNQAAYINSPLDPDIALKLEQALYHHGQFAGIPTQEEIIRWCYKQKPLLKWLSKIRFSEMRKA